MVITIEDDGFFRISAEEYYVIINLNTYNLNSAITTNAFAKEKSGFVLNKKGYVKSTSASAQHWLDIRAFDDVKKANAKSYPHIIFRLYSRLYLLILQ